MIDKCMYFFSLTHYAGFDRVFICDDYNFTVVAGDYVVVGDQQLICLGTEIAFIEQYTKSLVLSEEPRVVHKKLLSTSTMSMIHRMVHQYYATYKAVMKLFISYDIDTLHKKEVKTKKKPYFLQHFIATELCGAERGNREISLNDKRDLSAMLEMTNENYVGQKHTGQQLIIFPDIWTMTQTIPAAFLANTDVQMLVSTMTQLQKNIAWWKTKRGHIGTVICTHAEIFQDWLDLQQIILVEPYKWYYYNQQDPRYKVQEVVQQMGKIYEADVITI